MGDWIHARCLSSPVTMCSVNESKTIPQSEAMMKHQTVVLAAFALAPFSMTSSPLHAAEFEDHVFEDSLGNTMSYRLYLPEGHDTPDHRFPVVMWLHGDGDTVGSRPQPLVDRLSQGPYAAYLVEPEAGAEKWINCDGAALDNQDHIHCRQGFTSSMELALGVLEEVESQHAVDTTRRVLAGYSAGGGGVFDVIRKMPGHFSAAVPIQSGNEARRYREPVGTRVWAMHARDDTLLLPYFTSSVVDALTNLGESPIYLEPPGGHDAPYMNAFFSDPDDELYAWMFDAAEPPLAKLIYDPTRGEVVVDASTAPGGSISRMEISAGPRSTSQPSINEINGDPVSLSRGVIGYEASDDVGFGGTVALGAILPPGLGLTELHDALTRFNYDAPSATHQRRTFRVVVAETETTPPLTKNVEEAEVPDPRNVVWTNVLCPPHLTVPPSPSPNRLGRRVHQRSLHSHAHVLRPGDLGLR